MHFSFKNIACGSCLIYALTPLAGCYKPSVQSPVDVVVDTTEDTSLEPEKTTDRTDLAPTATSISVATAEDTPVVDSLQGNDPENSAVSFVLKTSPSNGSVVLTDATNGTFIYTPNPNVYGVDHFNFAVSDGTSESSPATVEITIAPVNDAPIATDDTATTDEDQPATLTELLANDSDVDAYALKIIGVTPAGNGTVTLNDDGSVAYVPNPNFSGTDTFSYTISDDNGSHASAAVALTVRPANDAPIAVDDAVTTDEDVPIIISGLTANDSDLDGDPLTIENVTTPSNGTLTKKLDGNVLYTPNANYYGNDGFDYTIADGHGGRATASVRVSVLPTNDRPTANADAATTPRNSSVSIDITSNDTGLGDAPITMDIANTPTNGSITVDNAGNVTYTPKNDYVGSDVFTYRLSDKDNETTLADVQIEVTCPNKCDRAITVSWPNNHESDLAGYFLYHGLTSGKFTDRIRVDDTNSFDFITNIVGKHFFAISAFDTAGNESVLSPEANITINP